MLYNCYYCVFVILTNKKVRFLRRTQIGFIIKLNNLSVTVKHNRHYQHQHIFILIAALR